MVGFLVGKGGTRCCFTSASNLKCSAACSAPSKVEVLDAGCQWVALRSENGKICSDPFGSDQAACRNDTIGSNERFAVQQTGTTVSLLGGSSGMSAFTWRPCDANCSLPAPNAGVRPLLVTAGSRVDLGSKRQRNFCLTATIQTSATNTTILAKVFRSKRWNEASKVEGQVWSEALSDKDQKALHAQAKADSFEERKRLDKEQDRLHAEKATSKNATRERELEQQIKANEKRLLEVDAWPDVVRSQFDRAPSAKAEPGAKVLFLLQGKVCFGVAGKRPICGQRQVNDTHPHKVGVSWDSNNFTVWVDGKMDAFGMGDAEFDEPIGSALVLGIAVANVAAEIPHQVNDTTAITGVSYNGQLVDARAFAGFPTVAALAKPVQATEVDLSSSRSDGRDFALTARLTTLSGSLEETAVIMAKAAKDKASGRWQLARGGLALLLYQGRLRFLVGATAALDGRTMINDGLEHEVGVVWDGTHLFLEVDGRRESEAGSPRDGFRDDPGTSLVVGEQVFGAATLRLAGKVDGVVYNGQPVNVSFPSSASSSSPSTAVAASMSSSSAETPTPTTQKPVEVEKRTASTPTKAPKRSTSPASTKQAGSDKGR